MHNQEEAASATKMAIRDVLFNDWDPIGVKDDPNWPNDEYDSYIAAIQGFLDRGESAEFIARHLCFVEEHLMGLGAPPVQARLNVAQKLKVVHAQVVRG